MKTAFFLLIVFFAAHSITAQHGPNSMTNSGNPAAVKAWMDNLYEVGVVVAKDTFTITEEAQRVAVDSQWRKVIYPAEYTWGDAQYLLKSMHIKTGLWYLINLYAAGEANHDAVLTYVISLEEVLDMQKALTASFYTYVFFDPQAGSLVRGRPVIDRPDILDRKLLAVREMISEVMKRR